MNDAAERAFFLEEFRQRTLLIAVGPVAPSADRVRLSDTLDESVRALLANATRVLLISAGMSELGADALARRHGTSAVSGLQPSKPEGIDELAGLWIDLDERGVAVVDVGDDVTSDIACAAAQLATRLRADKLVLTDAGGGWGTPTRSFADLEDLDGAVDTDESAVTERRPVMQAVREALAGGVSSVNLCRIDDLDTELFTFDGSGTLFTHDGYIRVAPLTLDDLPVVEELVAHGVDEGFLRPRPRVEVVRIALSGMGARVSSSGHLAAIGSLEVNRYANGGVGEVTCLYTVNRFAGEGAAGLLVESLVTSATGRGLRALFACTVSERAAVFFRRHGFRDVDHAQLPDAKWVGYDPERRAHISALWLDLEGAP